MRFTPPGKNEIPFSQITHYLNPMNTLHMNTLKFSWICGTASLLLLGFQSSPALAQTAQVYKSPTCGCCSAWVDYLRENDIVVKTTDLVDLDSIKKEQGIAPALQSCHTALIDGYVIEGHVPVNDIRRLLEERPDIVGLSAPGMPAMSPGMASRTPRDYDVLSFDKDGEVRVFSRY